MTDLVRQGEPRWQTSFGPIDRGMGSSDVRISVRHLTETCAGAFKAGTPRKSEDGDQWYVCVDPADPGAKVLMAAGLADEDCGGTLREAKHEVSQAVCRMSVDVLA